MSSTFRVEVVRLGPIEKHTNADTLGITHVWGYQIVVRLDDWHEGDLAAYIPPDSVVPDTEAYAFLAGHRRITVKKLRGEYSMGLLVPAPAGSNVGDDVAEQLGVIHYEPPPEAVAGGEYAPTPPGYKPTYDVEHFLRYNTLFEPGEPVIATEKIHGASGRWTYQDGEFRVGSHSEWKRYDPKSPNIWWQFIMGNEMVRDFLKHFEGITLYGEVYGWVMELRYGHAKGTSSVRFFDAWKEPDAIWVAHDEARVLANFPMDLWVPEIYRGPFDPDVLAEMAVGHSMVPGADHKREGIVIKPTVERNTLGGRRLQLKLINPEYLEKSR